MEKEIEIELNEKFFITFIALAILLAVVINDTLVTLKYPIVFGDEGFHSALARWIARNLEYPVYYDFIGNNVEKNGFYRPPLWNLLGSSFFYLFGETGYRLLLSLVVFTYGLGVFVFVSKLWNERAALIAMTLAITIPSFVTYSVLFYVDALFTMNMTFFVLFYLLYEKESNKKYLILSSIFGVLTILTKTPGLAVYLFTAFVLLKKVIEKKNFIKPLKELSPYILILAFSLVFFARNFYLYHSACILHTPIDKFFGENLCSIHEYKNKLKFAGRTEKIGTEADIYTIGLFNYLKFAYGNLLITILPLLGALVYLKESNVHFEKYLLLFLVTFVFLWVMSPGIGYRAEDTARYTLGWSGIFMITAVMWIEKIISAIEERINKKNYVYIVFVIFVVLSSFIAFNPYAFFPRLGSLKLVKSYSQRFFEACDWVKNNLPENTTLMSLWVYRVTYNCDRRASGGPVDLRLSTDVNTSIAVAKIAGIDYIFLEKFSIDPENKHYSEKYDLNWVEYLESHPEVFKPVYENGISMSECMNYLKYGYPCDGIKIYQIIKE